MKCKSSVSVGLRFVVAETCRFVEVDVFTAVSHHVTVWFVHTEVAALKIEVFLPGLTVLRH